MTTFSKALRRVRLFGSRLHLRCLSTLVAQRHLDRSSVALEGELGGASWVCGFASWPWLLSGLLTWLLLHLVHVESLFNLQLLTLLHFRRACVCARCILALVCPAESIHIFLRCVCSIQVAEHFFISILLLGLRLFLRRHSSVDCLLRELLTWQCLLFTHHNDVARVLLTQTACLCKWTRSGSNFERTVVQHQLIIHASIYKRCWVVGIFNSRPALIQLIGVKEDRILDVLSLRKLWRILWQGLARTVWCLGGVGSHRLSALLKCFEVACIQLVLGLLDSLHATHCKLHVAARTA